jgi:hypothetical protein
MSELPRNKYANENSLCVPLNLMLALATNVLTRETQTIISIYHSPAVCKRTFLRDNVYGSSATARERCPRTESCKPTRIGKRKRPLGADVASEDESIT